MSLLAKEIILDEIEKGNIKIEPLNKENIGPASIDLTLSNEFRIFKKSNKIINITENTDYKSLTKLVKQDSIIIKPKQTIIGLTKEKITLSENIAGLLEGRSRFARLGLTIHITAPFMPPGIDNHKVLEISNLGQLPLKLNAGTKICQFIFLRTEGKSKYNGLFSKQSRL